MDGQAELGGLAKYRDGIPAYGHPSLYICDGLMNINASVRNIWKSHGKVTEFDEF